MKANLRKTLALAVFLSATALFAQENEVSANEIPVNEVPAVESSSDSASASGKKDSVFLTNLTSLTGHRFIEVRGAFPAFPLLTSHGVFQSFVVGFGDVFGEIFTPGNDYDNTTPYFATDLNVTIFPPIANYHCAFLAGAAIDKWERKVKGTSETFSMNFYYIGFYGEYGHWVFSDIGTSLALYGEVSVGWMHYIDDSDKDYSFAFDACPFGIQFCPEKNIGIYFEIPHFGARPFFQTGLSIGF